MLPKTKAPQYKHTERWACRN